ncbi:lipoyl(octanoyl) transferase LipB [bacterium]|nr:lipoyl(octanoyl) transferase LipB [bacterium]
MQTSQPGLQIEARGRERYADTWARQLELHRARVAGTAPDTLILVEHEPVITLGRQGEESNLLVSEAQLAARGFDLHRIERGGDITYHGPGQLVGYPILSLRERGMSVRDFVSGIEEALIRTAAAFGVTAARSPGFPGVWVGSDKLAAIGVAIRGGVSYHGFAFNVCTDLSHFDLIVPCGLEGKGVISLGKLLGRQVALDDAAAAGIEAMQAVFGRGAQSAP